jgi:hypothetical protein
MRHCDCPVCKPREDMISRYMRVFAIGFPEAVEMLAAEERSFWIAATTGMSERHGLDDDAAVSHVQAHGVPQPERMQ